MKYKIQNLRNYYKKKLFHFQKSIPSSLLLKGLIWKACFIESFHTKKEERIKRGGKDCSSDVAKRPGKRSSHVRHCSFACWKVHISAAIGRVGLLFYLPKFK